VDVGILVPGLDHLGTLAELHDLDQNRIPQKEERGQVEKDPTVDRQCLDEEGMLGAEKIQRRELALVFLVSACIPQSGNLTRNLASLALCKKYRLYWMERRDAAVDSPLSILSQSMMQELPKMLCVTPK